MDYLVFFFFSFFSVFLLYFYFKEAVIYLGIFAGGIFILLGITLTMGITGDNLNPITFVSCEHFVYNSTVTHTMDTTPAVQYANVTAFNHEVHCVDVELPGDRNIFNAFGLMFITCGMGLIADCWNVFKRRREDPEVKE